MTRSDSARQTTALMSILPASRERKSAAMRMAASLGTGSPEIASMTAKLKNRISLAKRAANKEWRLGNRSEAMKHERAKQKARKEFDAWVARVRKAQEGAA